jgi:hypothetical protein
MLPDQRACQCCALVIPEMNRICLVLFDMNNRILGPCLAAINRILISVLSGVCAAGVGNP